jgi:hypothetical protein
MHCTCAVTIVLLTAMVHYVSVTMHVCDLYFYDRSKRVTSDGTGATTAITTAGAALLGAASTGSAGTTANDFESSTSENK